MSILSEDEFDNLNNEELVQRMDNILSAPYWGRMGNEIIGLRATKIFNTKRVQSFSQNFQRSILYKAFGLLLQIHYTDLSIGAKFFCIPDRDGIFANQLHFAARNQWTSISSRIIFEYFIHLTYMIGTGQEFKAGKSAMKKYIAWLKEKNNPYTYFSINVMKAKAYDRAKRSPEVHGGTKLARKILTASATNIDNEMFIIVNMIMNQWQFILRIANYENPKNFGWVKNETVIGDEEWYRIWESGDQESINTQIDKMLIQSDSWFDTDTLL
ncbi:hypothetical protein VU08_04580 [Desulfobulbus sp. F5]|nr:hypothetical protein [Desulfobulbus sp. F5]